jgi:uncharacterized protein (DUF1697 family)
MEGKKGRRYVAFLRGINVGGHAVVKMTDLRAAFAKMGFEDVRTVLASGNVVFAAPAADEPSLSRKIASGLKTLLQSDVSVALRSLDDLARLRAADPFRGIRMTPDIRLYVTFRAQPAAASPAALPAVIPQGGFRVVSATATEVFSVLDLSLGTGTPEAMGLIEKAFGANVTTRNWNTVLKMLA